MKLLHILKAKYILIALTLATACYVLLFIYTEIDPPEIDIDTDQSQQQTTLFFTDMYPKKVLWLNKNEILIQEEQHIVIYDIRNRKSKTIYENRAPSENTNTSDDLATTIKNCWLMDTTIIVAIENEEETQIFKYNLNGDKLIDDDESTHQVLQNADFIEIDNGLICSTKNFIIENPEEIATIIQIKPFIPEKDVKSTQLETNLTVKPLNCNSEKLILTQSSPFLEKSLYFWIPGEDMPEQIKLDTATNDTISTPNPVTNVLYFPKQKMTGIQASNSTVILVNTDTLLQSPINDINGPWTLINSEDFIWLNKDDSANNIYEIRSAHIDDLSKERTFSEFYSDENFLALYPNNTLTSFALISEFGELWILQVQ